MNCKEANKNLIFLIEKELSSEREIELRAHLNECKSCDKIYNELKATLSVVETEKQIETNPYFFTRLEQRINNPDEEKSNFNYKKVLQPIFAGLLLLISINIGIYLGNNSSINNLTTNSEESRSEKVTAYSEEFDLAYFDIDSYNTFYSTETNE
ncbi:MAG: zf-HC2 domain-containing protein [Saprospiraceae bacterium]|nr:zf-HC2 domain-containing protein [Saprospiraceae bacterium]